MQANEIEKSKFRNLLEIIDYVPFSVVRKTIVRKTTGNISLFAIDAGEVLAEKVTPFDSFIQIIEGSAEIVIDDHSNMLHAGQVIIVPAHTSNIIKANGRFKMMSTVIKSGYEEIIL